MDVAPDRPPRHRGDRRGEHHDPADDRDRVPPDLSFYVERVATAAIELADRRIQPLPDHLHVQLQPGRREMRV